jgi:hypothetical protein
MGDVVSLTDWKVKKLVESLTGDEDTSGRIDADHFFSELQRRNDENKQRMERERFKDNCGVIKSSRLKE